MNIYIEFANWLNSNTGVLTLIIFVTTIFLGWLSGIFSALRRKPKFKVTLIEGPTFSCTYPTGKMKEQYEIHRTGVALYLSVVNIGSSPSSINNVSVAYHWNIKPFSRLWLKYSLGWFWLQKQAVALDDFQCCIGAKIKVYPFLFQNTTLGSHKGETYLNIGQATNGVIYFEQQDSWGACFPKVKGDMVKIKVMILDAFEKKHVYKFLIPSVSIESARKYNPSFGKTLSELNGEVLPHDKKI